MRDIPNKTPGSLFYAAECTDMFSEEENIITDTGIALSASDLRQISKAVANYVGSGDYYTDSSIGPNAYVLSPTGLKQAPTAYAVGLKARFFPVFSNTSTTVTVNINSLGTKNIVRGNGTSLQPGEIHINLINEIVYDGTNFRLISSDVAGHSEPISPKFRDCILKNNSTDPTKDIDFGPGYFRGTDATGAERTFHNVSTITKQADAPWADGSGTGGMSGGTLTASSWYHEFYIAKDDGTVNAGFDTDINASNLLTAASGLGYRYYARRTSFLTDSTNNIIAFSIKDNTIWWASLPPIVTTLPGTSFSNITISTPNGVITEAMLEHLIVYADAAPPFPQYYAGAQFGSLVAGIVQDVNFVTVGYEAAISSLASAADLNILANTNSQVEFRHYQSTGTGLTVVSSQVRTIGYKEIYNQ
jgi:hypothetical protein